MLLLGGLPQNSFPDAAGLGKAGAGRARRAGRWPGRGAVRALPAPSLTLVLSSPEPRRGGMRGEQNSAGIRPLARRRPCSLPGPRPPQRPSAPGPWAEWPCVLWASACAPGRWVSAWPAVTVPAGASAPGGCTRGGGPGARRSVGESVCVCVQRAGAAKGGSIAPPTAPQASSGLQPLHCPHCLPQVSCLPTRWGFPLLPATPKLPAPQTLSFLVPFAPVPGVPARPSWSHAILGLGPRGRPDRKPCPLTPAELGPRHTDAPKGQAAGASP